MSDRCKARDDCGYWFNPTHPSIDPSDPSFVSGKGVWVPRFVQCTKIANEDSGMCPRHEFLSAYGEQEAL